MHVPYDRAERTKDALLSLFHCTVYTVFILREVNYVFFQQTDRTFHLTPVYVYVYHATCAIDILFYIVCIIHNIKVTGDMHTKFVSARVSIE
jgi:hypothetical protein